MSATVEPSSAALSWSTRGGDSGAAGRKEPLLVLAYGAGDDSPRHRCRRRKEADTTVEGGSVRHRRPPLTQCSPGAPEVAAAVARGHGWTRGAIHLLLGNLNEGSPWLASMDGWGTKRFSWGSTKYKVDLPI